MDRELDRNALPPGEGAPRDIAPGRYRSAFGALGVALAEQRERWALWVPVGLGAGIGLYFLLPSEPPLWIGPALTAGLALVVIFVRDRLALLVCALAALSVAAGFGAAQLRTELVATPVLHKRIGPVELTARVIAVEPRAAGRRLLLDRIELGRLPAARTPRRIRLGDRRGTPELRPGARVRLRAILLPPPRPLAPGAFDFARRDYFRKVGAVGFLIAPPEILGQTARSSLAIRIAGLRQRVSKRITEALPGATGGLAAALLTGDRGRIPAPTMAAIRDAGLAHLLAISGLHLSLVALILFAGLRALFAAMPSLALKRPIKKWAALGAMAGAGFYLLLTGATVPTQRAYLMLCIVLLAVLVDRVAISMRMVAIAATVILLMAPESLVSVSFQMSFAAVVALVAVYEALRARAPGWRHDRHWPNRLALYLGAVALTTLVAGAATAPFAVFHFNRIAAYGLAANMIAVPATALWIMPWGLLALLLMPFGLEGLALVPMGWGLDLVVLVAERVAGWPGAVTLVPAMPAGGLAAVALGALLLALWRGQWRYLGIPVIALGLMSGTLVRQPDVLVAEDGRLLAVRGGDGRLVLSSRRHSRFRGDAWLRRAGQAGSPVWAVEMGGAGGLARPGALARAGPRLACDALGCLYRAEGQIVAIARSPMALAEDCALADVMISLEPIRRRGCAGPRVVLDRFDLWRRGSHALYLRPDGVIVQSVRALQGERPWTRKPERTTRRWRRRTGRRRTKP